MTWNKIKQIYKLVGPMAENGHKILTVVSYHMDELVIRRRVRPRVLLKEELAQETWLE